MLVRLPDTSSSPRSQLRKRVILREVLMDFAAAYIRYGEVYLVIDAVTSKMNCKSRIWNDERAFRKVAKQPLA
jgi:hypothetical protein